MNDQSIFIDQQVFARTAGLFERKRNLLSPDVVEHFARDIVARVAEVMSARVPSLRTHISSEDVSVFCDLLLQPDQPRVALEFIKARRAEGVTVQDVYLGYIGESARLLGTRWEKDELTPLDVTIGAGTLYALMRALRAGGSNPLHDLDMRKAALFATVPGEQHGIGITVAADIFREAGWAIDLQINLDEAALVARVEQTLPRIVGLSLSTRERLPELLKLVVALRITAPGTWIGVAPGGDLTGLDVQSVADVDMVLTDAPAALAALEQLVLR
jgi:MerR family transcriptional regulator, light-induced transcriptional regulator